MSSAMLGDGKLDSLDTRLEQFQLSNRSNQDELQGILKEYAQVLGDYKALKKAFADKGGVNLIDGDTNGAKPPRNPYVLLLIDANGYIFNNELVQDKEEGGMRAARMLHDAVEKYLRESFPQLKDCRIVVRAYADLTNLSKQLGKAKLCGLEKRSLAAFTAAFTRGMNHFDFVDALDEEGTKFKIRDAFKLAVEDSACSHILYAACHDSGYLSQLVPYNRMRNRITLVQGASFNSEFHQFGLNVHQFPTVFRWSGLPASAPPAKPVATTSHQPSQASKGSVSQQSNGQGSRATPPWRVRHSYNADASANDMSHHTNNGFPARSSSPWSDQPEPQQKAKATCKYYQKGNCKYGKKCNFQHLPSNTTAQDHHSVGVTLDRSQISASLPTAGVPNFIPVNKDDQRIDLYVRQPTQQEWTVYQNRFQQRKPCNTYHLTGACVQLNCPYDHSDLDAESRLCLEYIVKCNPCSKKSACRDAECVYGHMCQRDDCVGQMKGCHMKADLHNVDPRLASWVRAEEKEFLLQDDHMQLPVNPDYLW